MYLRGTKNPRCALCKNAYISNEIITCSFKKENVNANDFCKKFDYDILKYIPKKKVDFGKFKKEDFEL